MSKVNQTAKKAEQAKEEHRLGKIKKHKCVGCPFSSWTGLKFYCPYGSCAKDSLRR